MIAVDNDSKVLQIKLSGAVTTNQLDWNITYYSGGAGANSFDGTTNGTTLVTLCPGTTLSVTNPAVISFRLVAMINVYNADTVPQTVSIIYKNGSSSRTLMKTLLGVGYTLAYEDHEGWYVIDDNGARINIEISLSGIAIGDTVVGAVNDKLLYVDSSGTLQEIDLGTNISLTGNVLNVATMGGETLAQTLAIGNTTGGNDIVLTAGDLIVASDGFGSLDLDNKAKLSYVNGAENYKVHMGSGQFEINYNSGTVISGIAFADLSTTIQHDAKLVFDAPIYNFAQLSASTVPYLDAGKNLVSSSVTPTQLGYLSSATGTTGTGKFVFDASPTITGHITVEGVTATGATGTGKFVFDASPILITPVLGVASATSLAITGTGGNGFATFLTQSSQPTYGASGIVLYANASGRPAWRRQSDTYERSFAGAITADRAYTLPDESGTLLTDQTVSSGTYIPTATGVTNIDAAAGVLSRWIKIGSQVFVSGQFTADATTTLTGTILTLSVPVTTANFTISTQAAGCAAANTNTGNAGRFVSTIGAQTVTFVFIPTSTGNQTYGFEFSYTIQ